MTEKNNNKYYYDDDTFQFFVIFVLLKKWGKKRTIPFEKNQKIFQNKKSDSMMETIITGER